MTTSTQLLPTIKQLMQLVGNPNAYALQLESGAYVPVREPLTPLVMRLHRMGEHTIGTYILDKDKACTLVFDVDDGDFSKAVQIEAALKALGIPGRGIGIEFSGNKGYHVWVVLANYMEAKELRRLGAAVLERVQFDCEVFPKQNEAVDLGNLVKLPGGIHRVSGLRAAFLDHIPQPISRSIVFEKIQRLPAPKKKEISYVSDFECLHTIQTEGPTEGWRNHGLHHLAVMLRKGGVSGENLRDIVYKANELCSPAPLSEHEVEALLSSSERSGPLCRTLPTDVQCESCPMLRPSGGLFVKAGQLRHGGVGEIVTVVLKERRDDGSVVLEHPDISGGIATLNR